MAVVRKQQTARAHPSHPFSPSSHSIPPTLDFLHLRERFSRFKSASSAPLAGRHPTWRTPVNRGGWRRSRLDPLTTRWTSYQARPRYSQHIRPPSMNLVNLSTRHATCAFRYQIRASSAIGGGQTIEASIGRAKRGELGRLLISCRPFRPDRCNLPILLRDCCLVSASKHVSYSGKESPGSETFWPPCPFIISSPSSSPVRQRCCRPPVCPGTMMLR